MEVFMGRRVFHFCVFRSSSGRNLWQRASWERRTRGAYVEARSDLASFQSRSLSLIVVSNLRLTGFTGLPRFVCLRSLPRFARGGKWSGDLRRDQRDLRRN